MLAAYSAPYIDVHLTDEEADQRTLPRITQLIFFLKSPSPSHRCPVSCSEVCLVVLQGS